MPQFRKFTLHSATWLALSLLIFGCAQDPAGPGRSGDQPPVVGPVAVSINQTVVDDLTATLQCLFDAGVIPNPQSTLGKLETMLAAIEAGDYPAALKAYRDLYAFLLNWQSNNNTNLEAPLSCQGVPAANVRDAFELAFTDLLSLAEGIPGELCLVEGAGQCELEILDKDGNVVEKAVVYFPPEIYSQLTAVSLELNPEGLEKLQNKLDEYPTYVRILTSGNGNFTSDTDFPNKPLVVVCFSQSILNNTPQTVLDRLLLGSLHDGTDFKLLATPQGDDADRLDEYCPPPPSGTAFGTGVGSVLSRLANLFLPARLHATRLLLTTRGGVGGSAEEFSDFGAVDPGIKTSGGVGGSAEEFAPPSAAGATGGPSAVVVSDDGTTYTGEIDEVLNNPASRPTVTAVSPVLETPVAGVKVTFTLVPPTSLLATSAATFCDNTTTYEIVTDANGTAVAPCINFGPTPGYMRLEARMNASDIDPLACLLNGAESIACTGQLTRVFLLETYEAPAALSCSLGDKTNKVSFGAYNSATSKWIAWFEFSPELPGRIRQVSLNMSVSGRASGLSDFPVTLTAYRADANNTLLSIGTRVLNSATGNLQLPGDNGSPYPVVIGLSPSGVTPDYNSTGKVVFKLEVTAPSTRTPQLWYRTDKFDDPSCLGAIVYANGLTPTTAASKDTKAGLGIIINNTVWR